MSFNEPPTLPDGWKIQTVGELVEKGILAKPLDGNHGGIHPKSSDYVDQGVPFIMASDLEGGQVDLTGCKFISEKQASTLRKGFAKTGDVLLSHKATIGRTAIVQESEYPFVMLTPQVTYYRVNDAEKLTPSYLKAYFDSNFFQTILGQWAGSGSTRAYLGITGQLKLPIVVPPIGFQNLVASQVEALNEKIQLNHQINQTLEAIAQAIFKSWFVDFDPVKAKIAAIEQGQDPLRAAMRAISGKTDAELDQMPREHYDQLAATAALFPDAMEESELGEIPKGWEEKSLDKIAFYLNGLALQKFPPESEDEYLPVIKIAQLRAGHASGADHASKNIKPEYIVQDGDVLFSWSGSLEVDVWTGGAGALNQHLFKVTSENVPKWFYYFATKHYLLHFREIAANKATTMGHIQRKHLSDAKIAIPPAGVIKAATEIIDPTFRQMITTRLQSNQLAHLRDTLLPKLLSGELSINPMQEANDD